MAKNFEIIGEITNIEIIAVGTSITVLKRLKRLYGAGRWRKLKGIARVRFPDGFVCKAEIHWYEMSNIGRKEYKIKRLL
jgi:hypothetical protein